MEATVCRCPNRPYLGSMAKDSAMERAALARWQSEHGHHPYSKARDQLAGALQGAESAVRREEQNKAGEAVVEMVHDIMGIERRVSYPRPDVDVDDETRERAMRNGMPPSGRFA